MSKQRRQSRRNLFQCLISDPLIAGFVWLFFKIFRALPVRVASQAGAFVGSGLYYVMYKRNLAGRRNLEIAFPQKTSAERELILKKMWQHWGRFFAEMPHGPELYKTAYIDGIEYIKEIAAQKKGCFICSAHLGNWEPAASVPLFDEYYLNPVYRAANNPWIDKILFQRRKGILIPKGSAGAKKMMEVLRQGGAVVVLCDQKLREGIDVPFFGKLVKTAPAVATAALKMDLPILMARCLRRHDGRLDIRVFPLPMPDLSDTSDPVYAIMAQINQIIEQWIIETPEQWLWVHHRFDKSEYQKK